MNRQYLKIALGALTIITFLLWGCPTYQVFYAGMTGKAAYRKATYNRQVRVLEAKAEAEAALWHRQRDTIQAYGIARANAIIGNSLKDNQPYLVFKWLETLKEIKGHGQVIYLPGLSPNFQLPITEAGRLQARDTVITNKPD